ncbi:MAG: peptidase M10A and M12B matrixin and adamalysin [Planctomycetota bacterium]
MIEFDYGLDINNFFNGSAERNALEAAGDFFESRLLDDLAAIIPIGGMNTWSASFTNPGTGSLTSVPNLTVPQRTLKVFVGGRNVFSGLAETSIGGFNVSGSSDWVATVSNRDQATTRGPTATDVGIWGGAISFDSTTNWHFGTSTAGLESNEFDFYSVALRQLGRLLGIGTSSSWNNLVDPLGPRFAGARSVAEYDFPGEPALTSDFQNWANGVTDGGELPAMGGDLLPGTRRSFTDLDLAALADIGWTLESTAVPEPGFFPILVVTIAGACIVRAR